jgi:hypothetical protein
MLSVVISPSHCFFFFFYIFMAFTQDFSEKGTNDFLSAFQEITSQLPQVFTPLSSFKLTSMADKLGGSQIFDFISF